MDKFFKENWIYILLPILLVLAAILYMVLTGDGNGASNFDGYEL